MFFWVLLDRSNLVDSFDLENSVPNILLATHINKQLQTKQHYAERVTLQSNTTPESGNNISFLFLPLNPLETSSWYTALQPPNKQVRSCGFRCSCGERQLIKSETET